VKTGVQVFRSYLNKLDSGACPGPDPGFAGMTKKMSFDFLRGRPSRLIEKRVQFNQKMMNPSGFEEYWNIGKME
jgi:hypothetical protein